MVAAIGEQILGPTDVLLSNWTVRPSSGCSVVLATHTAGVSVDGYTLTLAANPWNIVRTYNLTPGRELLFACRYRHGLQLRGAHVTVQQRLRPLVRQLRGRPGCLEHGQDVLHSASKRSGKAALLQNRACPTRQLERWTSTASRSWTQPWRPATRRVEEDTAASALLLKHEFLDGGADDVTLATLGEVLLEPTLTTQGNFEHRAHLHAEDATPLAAGTASNLVMYVSAADNDYVGVTGTFLGTPSLGVWSTARLDFSVPPGGMRSCFRRLDPRAGAAVGGHAGPVQHADQGLGLRGRVGLRDGPAGGLAGPHGLGHAGRAHRAGQRGLRPAAAQRRELHGRVHDGRGRLGRRFLRSAHSHRHRRRSHAVSGSSLSITGAASVGLLSSATGITGSTRTINNTANAGSGRRVHGHADCLGRSSRSHRGAHGRHTDHHRGGLRGPAGLREPGLHLHGHERRSVDGQRGLRRRDKLGHGLRAAALRLQHAHRDQHLRLLRRSLPDEELGGLEQAADLQQQRGLRQRSGAAAAGQPECQVFLERDGGTHQCELIMINDEALVQTRSLSTQLSLTTNQRNPGCLVTGNVVCNTSDSRVKTEIAEADVAELQQLFDSVEAKQYKRPDMNGDLRLGFASDDFAGTILCAVARSHFKVGPRGGATARRWSPSTALASPACSGGRARASRPGWTRWKPGRRPSGGRRTHKKHGRRPQANHQGRLRGSPHRFRQHGADAAAGSGARPQHLQRRFWTASRVNQDRPQRGYNSFVPLEPMNQLQVDLADGGKPYPFMLVAIDALTKKVAAEPLKAVLQAPPRRA